MVMRKEKNSIILEPGDRLCRYDLGTDLSVDWSTEYENPNILVVNLERKMRLEPFSFMIKRLQQKKL